MNKNLIFKCPLSVTSQFSFCGMPFRLDTFSGCDFLCSYCYSHKRGGNYSYETIKVADPELIIRKFNNAIQKNRKSTGLVSQYIQRRMPVHFGGMSDPLQNSEKRLGVTLEVLNYLCNIKYPVVLSTKSDLIINEKYLNLIKKNPNFIVQISFSTLNHEFSNIIEPYSPTPADRIRVLQTLSNNRIKTTLRWQPYIIGVSEHPVEFVKKISNTGINHLIIEFLKLPIDNNQSWNKSLAPFLNLRDLYYRTGSRIIGRELVLPPREKIDTINILKKELNRHKITLGVGDNELHYFSETDCCCGIDKYKGFNKWNKFQLSFAVKNHINNEILFSIIENQWKPSGSIDKFLNSKSRILNKHRFNEVNDYIINRWENLTSAFNPSKYYNVNCTNKRDENGFRIFKFKEN